MIERPDHTGPLPKAVAKDGAKWLLVPSKTTMKSFCNWPENRTLLISFLSQLLTFCFFVTVLGNINMILQNKNNLDVIVYALSMLVISAEAMGRRILFEIYAKTFRKLLLHVYYDFWPADIADEKTYREIKSKSRLLLNFFIGFTVVGVSSMIQTIMFAHMVGIKPMFTLYPQPFETSPYLELMYAMEAFLALDINQATNGTDMFLYTILFNCGAQFKLLTAYFKMNFEKVLEITDPEERGRKAKELIIKCVRHHNMILDSCKQLNGAYKYFMLWRFFTIVGAICLSIFIVNFQPQNSNKAVTYFLSHMIELFVYCFLGNEIITASMELTNVVFSCGWHNLDSDKDIEVKYALSMMIMRSQKPCVISVGGFGWLTLEIYVKLVRFSFSIFTLLDKAVNKDH